LGGLDGLGSGLEPAQNLPRVQGVVCAKQQVGGTDGLAVHWIQTDRQLDKYILKDLPFSPDPV